jgi:adenosylmethionine-8-amino-7-oxononanoate aminotransferase
MVGVDLGEHAPGLRMGHRVTIEARRRGAVVRPLGDTVVLMPPLAISKADVRRLVTIVAEAIRSAHASAYPASAAQPAPVELPLPPSERVAEAA